MPSGTMLNPWPHIALVLLLVALDALLAAAPAAAQSVPPAPSRPEGTTGDTQVTLTWSANGNGGSPITGWEYAQRTLTDDGWQHGAVTPISEYGAWTPISGSGPSTTSHTVTGLTNYTTSLVSQQLFE